MNLGQMDVVMLPEVIKHTRRKADDATTNKKGLISIEGHPSASPRSALIAVEHPQRR